ncbi:phosphoribosylamine--glycine ligase [Capsulimonas corticalis]|uniref:Phosphoribosylamine--glycine ligase n=1 Tax=Capsulimonas corticalis TaxID=2219043 RepID=A0A402CSB0_9BACT|nr:phosphoribosylamine--glycine ligase [Capsulimonas corticalis]
MKVLVVGGGGREHALVWKLAQSPQVSRIYAAPGNAGIAKNAECVPIASDDIEALLAFAVNNGIDLTVVGPEVPLIAGIVDRFEQQGLRIFGPAREPALMEGSKAYAKDIMQRYNIPTASYASFTSADAANHYLHTHFANNPTTPIVIKADGEAAGKGVFICPSESEATAAIHTVMVDKAFGASGDSVVIEEFLVGREASLMAFTDGTSLIPMIPVQDHKRAYDGDLGPNTGGMGCYAPVSFLTPALYAQAVDQILRPAVEAIRDTGIPYKGVLYAGVIVTPEGQLKTLEFNCRFGDPETQVVLPLLETDLVDILLGVTDAHLDEVVVTWKTQSAVCVTLASGGYPGPYPKGIPIHGLDQVAHLSDVVVFHAGTSNGPEGEVVTNGGRVITVTGLGEDFSQARARAYAAVKNISFEGMQYRTDIGHQAEPARTE